MAALRRLSEPPQRAMNRSPQRKQGPCELPGLSPKAVWGGAMRSMPAPPRLALVGCCVETGRWLAVAMNGHCKMIFLIFKWVPVNLEE